ncbi:zinc-dependent metalloprotease [Moorena sp. SIO3I8]|uniref:zinc-dependent metalloprotease n=1 Tax=Moorena sp. SIO3I8 TaxID=2607833 RepID=UPI0025E0D062|nr:zinc-dependent metalloprotease [Moorena sp. SIO3I8]
MKRLKFLIFCLCGFVLVLSPLYLQTIALSTPSGNSLGQHLDQKIVYSPQLTLAHSQVQTTEIAEDPSEAPSEELSDSDSSDSKLKPFDKVVEDAEKLAGLLTLYRNKEKEKIYLEIEPDQLNQNFLCVVTLASGIGELGLQTGWPVNDFLFQFRRRQKTIDLVIPNIYFRTRPGDPQERSVKRSFSDSVLYSLPITSIHPERKTLLVDLTSLLVSDGSFSGLASAFPWILGGSYGVDPQKSYVSDAQAFPLNVEIESVYGFSGGGDLFFPLRSLPDQRAFNLSVRYSFSQLPTNNGYRHRLADERVGYFISAYQNLSNQNRKQPFIRYIRRWNLEKQDPTATVSPPKEPIVFWIENTVPLEYRDAIREGILMWNEAFREAGFDNAIEVRQMPDDATWDPADIRYNTIRWSNSFPSFPGIIAMGPSRVNPLTGEILDADVIIDANAVRWIKAEYQAIASQAQSQALSGLSQFPFNGSLCSNGMKVPYLKLQEILKSNPGKAAQLSLPAGQFLSGLTQVPDHELCFAMVSAQQAKFGALSLSMVNHQLPSGEEMKTFINQYLRYLTAHEVGHTLGLRHNFRGSTMLSPEELNNTEITRNKGLVGSVMDYVPVNLAPEGMEQGDYFSTVVGPYDKWVIKYGYTPIDALTPQQELRTLRKIAAEGSEMGLSYATDEDTFDFIDPEAKVWDLSSDPLRYSQWQMENAKGIWKRLNTSYLLPQESAGDLRDRFDTVFSYFFENAMSLTGYIGGQTFNRNYTGGKTGTLPFEPIPVEKQRQALAMLGEYMFAEDTFNFSPQLLNQLAPSRWTHWGAFTTIFPLDYPIHERVMLVQTMVLGDLFSSERLARLRDAQLKTSSGEALTMAEVFDTVQDSIWKLDSNAKIEPISSLRRGLQRQYMSLLVNMALRNSNSLETARTFPEFIIAIQTFNTPEDARVLARYKLRQLRDAIANTLNKQGKNLDTASLAHLEGARDRITKVLDAPLQSE